MTPRELLDSCVERIDAWNAGERFADEPTIALTMMRQQPPSGDSVMLCGRSGPRGRLATARPKDGAWLVVAYFPAVVVGRYAAEALGLAPGVVPTPAPKT